MQNVVDLSHTVHPRLISLLALPVVADEETPQPFALPEDCASWSTVSPMSR